MLFRSHGHRQRPQGPGPPPRESYRVHEDRFRPGYDIVVVARARAAGARYAQLERSLLRLAGKLDLLKGEGEG